MSYLPPLKSFRRILGQVKCIGHLLNLVKELLENRSPYTEKLLVHLGGKGSI